MPSWRAFDLAAYQSSRYESQDVLADSCDLDLLCPRPEAGFVSREYWLRRVVFRDFTGSVARLNPGLRPIHLDREYDLFIAVFQTPKELLFLNAIRGWRDRCKLAVCMIDELYVSQVHRIRNFLRLLRPFDFVFTELIDSAEAISRTTGKPCIVIPPAVDAIRFVPPPEAPARVIDVYSIGRRRRGVHDVLYRLARDRGLFYVYDTFQKGAETEIADHVEHRLLISNLAKRSLCFMVAPAKWDSSDQTRGQIGIANRYFEGAAAGAVLVGQRTSTREFDELFDWQDAVVTIKEDGSDVEAVLRELKASPARAVSIGRRNVTEVLRRHDWVYRWRRVFESVGIRPGPKMAARERRLSELASLASSVSAP